jgi:hypothetical protein
MSSEKRAKKSFRGIEGNCKRRGGAKLLINAAPNPSVGRFADDVKVCVGFYNAVLFSDRTFWGPEFSDSHERLTLRHRCPRSDLTGFRGARSISCNCRENIKNHVNSLEIILVYILKS